MKDEEDSITNQVASFNRAAQTFDQERNNTWQEIDHTLMPPYLKVTSATPELQRLFRDLCVATTLLQKLIAGRLESLAAILDSLDAATVFQGQKLQIVDQLLEVVGDILSQHRFDKTESRGHDRNIGAPRQDYQPPHVITQIAKALEALDYSQRCRTILAQLEIIFCILLGREYMSNLTDHADNSGDHGADEELLQIDSDGKEEADTPEGREEDAMQSTPVGSS